MTTPTPTPTTRAPRVALLAVGSALVVALLVLASIQFAQAATGRDESGRYAVSSPFAALDIDVSAADVTVRYADVPTTRLDFDSGASALHLEREVRGSTLSVRVRQRGWWSFGAFGPFGDAHLDVVLPASAAPVALDLRSSAGDTDVAGAFSTTTLESSAGNIRLTGSSRTLRLESSAGDITATGLDVSGPVETDSSAGNTRLSFASLPTTIESTGSAGDIEVALPDGEYQIHTSTSFGDVDQALRSTPGADRRYTFETSAGNITLRSH